jgi:hypothetical protein
VVQKEMLRILLDEGFQVSMRELTRVRNRNRWLLRVTTETKKKKTLPNRLYYQESQEDGTHADEYGEDDVGDVEEDPVAGNENGGLDPAAGDEAESQLRKDYRKRVLAAESDEKWATRKRRRRTRAWAGLPADPPGPPRFPSETTLEESKTILNLDNDQYKDFRQRFQRICQDAGVLKKTIAGPEKWEAVKEQLIRESMNLRALLWDKDDMDARKLAIDVICCDVTKRMRMASKQMTLAEAKNILGMNPEEGREVRFAFYRILADDNFGGKLESGEDHWNELKQKWFAGSELIQKLLSSTDAATSRAERIKAIDMLARDVMKRYRDDKQRRPSNGIQRKDPTVDATPDGQVIDHEAFSSLDTDARIPVLGDSSTVGQVVMPSPPSRRRRGREQQTQLQVLAPVTQARLLPADILSTQPNLTIAPDLGSSLLLTPGPAQTSFVSPASYASPYDTPGAMYHTAASPAPSTSVAIYLRLHPSSDVISVMTTPLWIATLSSRSIEELRGVAVAKFPGTICLMVEGVIKDDKGGDILIPIPGDVELAAYLAHVQGSQGVAPTFNVQLVRGWNAS